MSKKYMFGLHPNGQVYIGTALDYPDEYTVEGTVEVWNNQNRSFYVNGEWTIYDPLTISTKVNVSVDEVFNAIATLPSGSPDTSVSFTVSHNRENSDPVVVDVIGGQALQQFSFDTTGTYVISANSEHHGTVSKDVVVS